ncbi:MAG: di-heme oxidoredictase family protein [bacterium]
MARHQVSQLILLAAVLGLAILAAPGCGGSANDLASPGNAPDSGDLALVDSDGGSRNAATVPPYPDNTATNARSGGATTVFDISTEAFETAAPNLNAADFAIHEEGNEAFEQEFFTAPATEHLGLGPVMNRESCEACHAGDGRGRPPNPGEEVESMLLRLSIPGFDPITGGVIGAPGFGGQLQDRCIPGSREEAKIGLSYVEIPGNFGNGQPYSLRKPTFTLVGPYIPAPAGLLISPRVAPSVFGLGLLEAIPSSVILARADPFDQNHDGISGRVNLVYNPETNQKGIGRFGWKANTINLHVQSAAAYNNDMGITSSVFSSETCAGQSQDDHGGDDPELDDDTLDANAFYTSTLGVPARRNINNNQIKRGETVFQQSLCAKCHTPVTLTGSSAISNALSFQRIQPFTDLLLHDMGPGLADNRPDFQATGQEWRTAPLWGMGLQETVNGHTNFLHDGR